MSEQNRSTAAILKHAIPKMSLVSLSVIERPIIEFHEIARELSDSYIIELRARVAKTRKTSYSLPKMYFKCFIRSELFIAINNEIKRRKENNIVVNETTAFPATVKYRRFIPK